MARKGALVQNIPYKECIARAAEHVTLEKMC